MLCTTILTSTLLNRFPYSNKVNSMSKPQAGDKLQCKQCGMEIEVKTACKCQDHEPKLECCGKPLEKV
tara:strand:+ start:2033 stop:2236 length:204 start_codon:yes stop_codon:yes gene_type:complete